MRTKALIATCALTLSCVLSSPVSGDMSTRHVEATAPVDRIYMDAVAAGRQLLFGRPLPVIHGQRNAVSAMQVEMELTALNRSKPTARNIRVLACVQFLAGSSTWQRTILRLRTIPHLAQTDVERELACWRASLVGPAPSTMVTQYASQIQSMQIGWFRHILLAGLYNHSGNTGQFEKEITNANRSTERLLLVWDFWSAARIIGMLANVAVVVACLLSRRLRSMLKGIWNSQVTQGSTSTLSVSAAIYLVGNLITAALWPVGNMALSEGMDSEGATSRLVLQVLFPLLPVVGWLAIQWKRQVFSLSQVGFDPLRIVRGAAIGISSYLLILPWLYGATWLSDAMTSGGFETPLHPAVAILAGTHAAMLRRVLMVIALLVAPLTEEIIFRGCIQNVFMKRWGVWVGLGLSTAAFAMVHPQLPAGLPVLLVLGAGFGAAYRLTRNLWVPITMHAVNNAAVLCVVTALFME